MGTDALTGDPNPTYGLVTGNAVGAGIAGGREKGAEEGVARCDDGGNDGGRGKAPDDKPAAISPAF